MVGIFSAAFAIGSEISISQISRGCKRRVEKWQDARNAFDGIVAYRADIRPDVEALFEKFGLADRMENYPDQLSGGQQQRVAIVRALAMQPEVMLFDEITSALDPQLVGEVLDVLLMLKAQGMTMVLATHEMGFARQVANRVIFMDAGQIVEQNEPEEFFNNPKSDRTQLFLSQILGH